MAETASTASTGPDFCHAAEHFPLFTSGPVATPSQGSTPMSFKDNPGGIIGAAQDPPQKKWELDTTLW